MAYFKKAGKRIFGVQLNKAEQKAMNAEINRQIIENQKKFLLDYDCMVLWTLHTVFGFGEKRLKAFYKEFTKQHLELIDYYQCDGDSGKLCKFKLKQKGFDIESWAKELEDFSNE